MTDPLESWAGLRESLETLQEAVVAALYALLRPVHWLFGHDFDTRVQARSYYGGGCVCGLIVTHPNYRDNLVHCRLLSRPLHARTAAGRLAVEVEVDAFIANAQAAEDRDVRLRGAVK